jgi:hypothetical protein
LHLQTNQYCQAQDLLKSLLEAWTITNAAGIIVIYFKREGAMWVISQNK